jgi:hypothetical protein
MRDLASALPFYSGKLVDVHKAFVTGGYMYFVTANSKVFHILEDAETGRAPSTCGARIRRIDLVRLSNGKPTRNVTKEKPADLSLCKHCQRAEA